ncbi:12608_t:CDS:2 [Funneliformis geosporum]|nr:12608_t:CDS:2 [Funneliformis geosporum]
MRSQSERMNGHKGTETRSLLLLRRQQWGIFCNGGNPDRAILREGGRSTDCKLLYLNVLAARMRRWFSKLLVGNRGLTSWKSVILLNLSAGEVNGTSCGARGEQNGLDTRVVHALNDDGGYPDTGAAWPSSVRAVRRKERMTPGRHGPYALGDTRATMAATRLHEGGIASNRKSAMLR